MIGLIPISTYNEKAYENIYQLFVEQEIEFRVQYLSVPDIPENKRTTYSHTGKNAQFVIMLTRKVFRGFILKPDMRDYISQLSLILALKYADEGIEFKVVDIPPVKCVKKFAKKY